MNNAVFLYVASCGFIIIRRFGETCRLHLQVDEISRARKSVRRYFFYPEDGGDMFL
jgi:hypothetical protein